LSFNRKFQGGRERYCAENSEREIILPNLQPLFPPPLFVVMAMKEKESDRERE